MRWIFTKQSPRDHSVRFWSMKLQQLVSAGEQDLAEYVRTVILADRGAGLRGRRKEGAAIDFAGCKQKLKAGRAPFVSPEVVARELSEGVASGALGFTAGADQDVVSKLYEKGFIKAFETACDMGAANIYYWHLGWGSEEAPVLAEAIKYAHEHCKAADEVPLLNFGGNKFTDEDEQMLKAAGGDGSRVKVYI